MSIDELDRTLLEPPADERLLRIEALTYGLLEAIGEEPGRPGLERTPERVARAWEFLTSGYRDDVHAVVNGALFPAESSGLVLVRDIPFSSLCEHHLLPFTGRLHVAYLPSETILGLSKLARIAEVFARRLQVQERLTTQIAETLMEILDAKGVGVVADAEHLCMLVRGVEAHGASTRTIATLGSFADDASARAELLASVDASRA